MLCKLIGRFVVGETKIGPFILTVAGAKLDLTGKTVELVLRDNAGSIVDTTDKVLVDADQTANTGHLYWTPATDDVSHEKSPYLLHVKVTTGDDPPLFFPSGPAYRLEADRA
jgi:hypothetical protein